jgi:arabinofuranan 3-O-arabinosyltransferase
VAVDLGDGPHARTIKTTGPQTVSLTPRITDTVTISLLDWKDVIDRTALGFDQLKPPGLADIAALGTDGRPIAAADAAGNRRRDVAIDCEHGPVIAIAGRFVHTDVHTTVGALLDGAPVTAHPCDADPIALPAGQQELVVSPGPQFVVDGAELSSPITAPSALAAPATTGTWGPSRREVQVPAAATPRVLVVPESRNPGWVARGSTGNRLTPLTVNGWQQAWVVPAGTSGTITLTFAPNALYQVGLAGGLALLPLLALLAWWPPRRRCTDPAAPPWTPGRWAAVPVLAAGFVIAGWGGLAVFVAALALRWVLRRHPARRDAVTLWLSAGGLILAGAALSRHPWRSVDGYAGHSAWVQLLALISLAAVAASTVHNSGSRANT